MKPYMMLIVLFVVGLVRGDAGAPSAVILPPSSLTLQDPLKVNSDTIVLKLENSRVRVLEATIKPGQKEATHSHPAYVVYVIQGGKVRMHGVDGSVNEVEFKTGDAIYRDPVTHWAENIGKTTIRLELVELKN